MNEVGVVPGGHEQPAPTLQQSVEQVGSIRPIGAGPKGHVVVGELDGMHRHERGQRLGRVQQRDVRDGVRQGDERPAGGGPGDGLGVVAAWRLIEIDRETRGHHPGAVALLPPGQTQRCAKDRGEPVSAQIPRIGRPPSVPGLE